MVPPNDDLGPVVTTSSVQDDCGRRVGDDVAVTGLDVVVEADKLARSPRMLFERIELADVVTTLTGTDAGPELIEQSKNTDRA